MTEQTIEAPKPKPERANPSQHGAKNQRLGIPEDSYLAYDDEGYSHEYRRGWIAEDMRIARGLGVRP